MAISSDEYDFDFLDNRNVLPLRWHNHLQEILKQIPPPDLPKVREHDNIDAVMEGVRNRARELKINSSLVQKLGPVFFTYRNLMAVFVKVMSPSEVKVGEFWGILYLRLWLALTSDRRFEISLETIGRTRKIAELFQRTMDNIKEENEVRNCMLELLEALMNVFVENIKFYRRYANDDESSDEWLNYKPRLEPYLKIMDEAVKHLHEISVRGQKIKEWEAEYQRTLNEKDRSTANRPGVEFPCVLLPSRSGEQFFFRESSLEKINDHLKWQGSTTLRTYTIYGRRGIGKTHLALAYAAQNRPKFDAIFWISCETMSSIRQSFANIALKLKLPGASKGVNHEENVRLVHEWLAATDKYWLLIFDNAEVEELVRNHWPSSKGAILITSRQWTNFSNDAQRRGETVPAFDEEERWEYLCALLSWQELVKNGSIDPEQVAAAKVVLARLEGLPLGIRVMASTLKSKRLSLTPKMFLEKFNYALETLPPKQIGTRSPPVQALDASEFMKEVKANVSVWSLTYSSLSTNARHFLNVLCLLSPDRISLDLFLPRNQAAVPDYLSFCRTGPTIALGTLLELPDALNAILAELQEFTLIHRTGRHVQLHRTVAEAAIEFSNKDLPLAMNAAVCLIHEAFPKQVDGSHFTKVYGRCADVLTHVDYIATRFSALKKARETQLASSGVENLSILQELVPPPEFPELLKNCSWYCYEIGAYPESFRLIGIAMELVPPGSLIAAHLLNTSGACYFELNKLNDCREAWEKAYDVRKDKLNNRGQEFASSIHNRGLAESGANNWDAALDWFKKAEDIRKSLSGEDVAISLAVTYLCMARCLVRLNRFDDATRRLDAAEYLIGTEAGPASQPMAFIYFIKGNMERRRDAPGEAVRWYRKGLDIMNDLLPGHVCTSSLYYKKGCAEMELGYLDDAIASLDKAQDLAEKSRSGSYDGNVARILWKRSQLLSQAVLNIPGQNDRAAALRVEAQFMRLQIGGSSNFEVEDDDPTARERNYDQLVCDFWRS